MRRALLLAVALSAILTPTAHAGLPFTIGEGSGPHVIADEAGTAHVTWHDETNRVFYCRVPREQRGCQGVVQTLMSSTADDTFLLHGGGTTLHLVQPFYAQRKTFLWTSTDNGTTWGPQQTIYSWGGGTGHSEPILGPQPGQITFASTNPDITTWAASLDGSESGSEAHATFATGASGYHAQIAPTADGGLVVVHNDLDNAYFHRLAPGGDPSAGPWSGPTLIGEGSETGVATGPSGTYMLATIGPTNPRQDIRKWNGTNFAPVTNVSEFGYINDITVSPSGGVAAVWRINDPSGNRLRMAFSPNGNPPYQMRNLLREETVMSHMDVALPSDNDGWVAYEGESGSSGARNLIRVADTDPLLENVVNPDPSAVKRDRDRVPGARLTLSARGTCINPTERFTANVAVRKTRRIFRGVARVTFLFGGEKAKTDRKRPFRKRLSLRRGVSGQEYRLRARVFYRLRGSARVRTKTLSVIVETCPIG